MAQSDKVRIWRKDGSILFRDPNWAKNMQFGADDAIFMAKKYERSL